LYCDLRIFKDNVLGKSRWLMSVILTTWEAEIRRIVVPGHVNVIDDTLDFYH
jgi:hypothetical protein